LWTAFMEGSQYAAGVKGVRVPEPGLSVTFALGLLATRCLRKR
jgi:hypothetical protein